jgi:hypothetical protein
VLAASAALTLACWALPPPRAAAQESRTNLDLFQSLTRTLGTEIAARARFAAGDTVELRTAPMPEGWIAEEGAGSALRTAGCTVLVLRPPGADTTLRLLEIPSASWSVHYDDPHRSGMFGQRRVRRTVGASLSFAARNRRTGELLAAGTVTGAALDTVAADAVTALEQGSAPSSHGELPQEQFLDKIAEPFVIIGATGIAVYLLFHVRS